MNSLLLKASIQLLSRHPPSIAGPCAPTIYCCTRTKMGPPRNVPFTGIYRKEGDLVWKDDLLVVQRKMNYHPGANVRYQAEFGAQHYLMADCDGTVVITREKADVDPDNELMQKEYAYRSYENLYKLTYNIVPRKMSQTFKLVDEV